MYAGADWNSRIRSGKRTALHRNYFWRRSSGGKTLFSNRSSPSRRTSANILVSPPNEMVRAAAWLSILIACGAGCYRIGAPIPIAFAPRYRR